MHSSGNKIGNAPARTIRRLSALDAAPAHAILMQTPEAARWSEEGLRESILQGIALAAEIEGRVAGVLIGRLAGDEFEILNLAVEQTFRRKGIATELVTAALEHAAAAGARRTFLEVRTSNHGAIALYSRMRFLQCGIRANYYRDPADDALLFVLHTVEK